MGRAKYSDSSDSDSEDSHRRTKSKSKSKSKTKSKSKSKSKSTSRSKLRSSRSDLSDSDSTSNSTTSSSSSTSSSEDVKYSSKELYNSTNEQDEDINIILSEIRNSLRAKLLSHSAKNLKKLSACYRQADADGHGFLSKSKFKSISLTKLKSDKLTKGEVMFMMEQLRARKKNKIDYEKLKEILTDGVVEFDDDEDDGWQGFTSESWAVRNGSVGEFLQNIGTPQDKKNFKDFLTLLDAFEKSHGTDTKRSVKIEKCGGVITVKLGPMLSCALKFYVD